MCYVPRLLCVVCGVCWTRRRMSAEGKNATEITQRFLSNFIFFKGHRRAWDFMHLKTNLYKGYYFFNGNASCLKNSLDWGIMNGMVSVNGS